jgi:hypothetical protein
VLSAGERRCAAVSLPSALIFADGALVQRLAGTTLDAVLDTLEVPRVAQVPPRSEARVLRWNGQVPSDPRWPKGYTAPSWGNRLDAETTARDHATRLAGIADELLAAYHAIEQDLAELEQDLRHGHELDRGDVRRIANHSPILVRVTELIGSTYPGESHDAMVELLAMHGIAAARSTPLIALLGSRHEASGS